MGEYEIRKSDKTGKTLTKLNQIVSVEKGVKHKTTTRWTELYRTLSKDGLWKGRIRTYKPKTEDGDVFPNESQLVQVRSAVVMDEVTKLLTRLFDLVFTHEVANAGAKADIVVDGQTLATDVPVTYMLFLEKQLTDLATFISNFPVLDPEQSWTYDAAKGVWISDKVETFKTKKEPKSFQLSPATDKHPAQVQLIHEDVVQGTWSQINLSGGLPYDTVAETAERIEKLRNAVKFAREEANNVEVNDYQVAQPLLDYMFAPINAAKDATVE
jgi:hypothetical protein